MGISVRMAKYMGAPETEAKKLAPRELPLNQALDIVIRNQGGMAPVSA
jgi:hypothetical protein